MSLRDLCDVAYAMQVDTLERRMVAQVAAGFITDDDTDLPDRARKEFDDLLIAREVPKRPQPTPRAESDRMTQVRAMFSDLGIEFR